MGRAVVEPYPQHPAQVGREAEWHGPDLMKMVMSLTYLSFGVVHVGVVKGMSCGDLKVMECLRGGLAHVQDGVKHDVENGVKKADCEQLTAVMCHNLGGMAY